MRRIVRLSRAAGTLSIRPSTMIQSSPRSQTTFSPLSPSIEEPEISTPSSARKAAARPPEEKEILTRAASTATQSCAAALHWRSACRAAEQSIQ